MHRSGVALVGKAHPQSPAASGEGKTSQQAKRNTSRNPHGKVAEDDTQGAAHAGTHGEADTEHPFI
jgi:hypothetical protein